MVGIDQQRQRRGAADAADLLGELGQRQQHQIGRAQHREARDRAGQHPHLEPDSGGEARRDRVEHRCRMHTRTTGQNCAHTLPPLGRRHPLALPVAPDPAILAQSATGKETQNAGTNRGHRRRRGRRLCRRPLDPPRPRRHADRPVARACRGDPRARAGARRPVGRGALHGQGARDAPDRGAVARQANADRHRLRLGEILRHRMGDHADPALPGAGRLRRVAAELHQRGAHRRHRRLGPHRRA